MIQREPEFKSTELQNAIAVQSSITALPKIMIIQNDILSQIKRYYAINDNKAYIQFELGILQGSKFQLTGSDLLVNLFHAIRSYLTNLSGNESKTKAQIEKLISNITNDIQLLFELSVPIEPKTSTQVVDTKSEIQALLLGLLTKTI